MHNISVRGIPVIPRTYFGSRPNRTPSFRARHLGPGNTHSSHILDLVRGMSISRAAAHSCTTASYCDHIRHHFCHPAIRNKRRSSHLHKTAFRRLSVGIRSPNTQIKNICPSDSTKPILAVCIRKLRQPRRTCDTTEDTPPVPHLSLRPSLSVRKIISK